MNVFAVTQGALLKTLKQGWSYTGLAMRTEYNQLVNDDEQKLTDYTQSIMADGQALVGEISGVQSKVAFIGNALQQTSTSYNSQQREFTNLTVATQNNYGWRWL